MCLLILTYKLLLIFLVVVVFMLTPFLSFIHCTDSLCDTAVFFFRYAPRERKIPSFYTRCCGLHIFDSKTIRVNFCHHDAFTVCTVPNFQGRECILGFYSICFVPCIKGNEAVSRSKSLCFGQKAAYPLNPMLMHAAARSLTPKTKPPGDRRCSKNN